MLISLALGIILGISLYQTRSHFKIMSIIVSISIIVGFVSIYNYTNSFHYEMMKEANQPTLSGIASFSRGALGMLIQLSFVVYIVFFIAKIFKKGNKDNVSSGK
ncbi:hypothetical protein CVO_04690 [Sulfurimonas sp. CVO]|uniref:hypothetical protein n=1 Tax=Sulfurimonas sp. CVO TaxID=2283483 RepID=UPI00132E82D5|nr:hypothetical protein [Sulfurimonas sp. CVO]QHG91178.1 hypothetical protein CVO_04690 [Sulfurimonas sp. CVO]